MGQTESSLREAESILSIHCYENPKLRVSIMYTGDLLCDARKLVELRTCLHEKASDTIHKIKDSKDIIPLQCESLVMMLNTASCGEFSMGIQFAEFREAVIKFLLKKGIKTKASSCCCCCCCNLNCCCQRKITKRLGVRREMNMHSVFSRPYFKYKLGLLDEPEVELPLHICISVRPPLNADQNMKVIYVGVYVSH
jgi:hypothetical protein